MHKCQSEDDMKKVEALVKAATQILTNYEQSDAGGKKGKLVTVVCKCIKTNILMKDIGGAKKKSKKRAL